jgi:hypothetical protein
MDEQFSAYFSVTLRTVMRLVRQCWKKLVKFTTYIHFFLITAIFSRMKEEGTEQANILS